MKSVIRAAALLSLLAIFITSLVPGQYRPHSGILPSGLEHVAAYAVAAFLLCLSACDWLSRVRIVLLLTVYGAVLEVAQLWVPDRHPQAIDVVVDFIGACLGVLAASAVMYRFASVIGQN